MGSAHRCHALWLLLGACATTVPPLAEPPVEVRTGYRQIGPGEPSTVGTRAVLVAVLALRDAPRGASVETQALAIAAEAPPPFRAVPSLPEGTLWLDAEATAAFTADLVFEADRVFKADTVAAAREPDTGASCQVLGTTTALAFAGVESVVATSVAGLPHLHLEAAADGCRLRLHGIAGPAHPADHLWLRDPLPDTGACLLFVAMPDRPFAGYAILMTAAPLPDDRTIAAALAEARTTAQPTAATSQAERQARLAARSVGEHNRRPALLAIAQQLALPRCIDALLCADERHLAAIGARTMDLAPTDAAYAWQFERAIWSAMLPALQRGELPPGLLGCLLRHFGALGEDATTLQLHLEASADGAAFERLVREENVFALASRDPVQRVRGHEWLLARDVPVPEYDPMAPSDVRRQVLRRHAAATAAAAAKAEVR